MLLTGAVAAAATALTMHGGSVEANHIGTEDYLAGVDDPIVGGGKMYSDKALGRPCYGLPEPQLSICYMTLLVDRTGGAEAAAYDAAVTGGLQKWNDTDTTISFDLVAYNYSANDVHIKTGDLFPITLDAGAVAYTEWRDFHNLDHGPCPRGDCNDPDGDPAHQPQRWWYGYITLDTGEAGGVVFLSQDVEVQKTIIAHELEHVLGAEDYDNFCSPTTIMDPWCVLSWGIRDPTPLVDVCMMNHYFWPWPPLMYGDAVDENGQSLAYRNCPTPP